MPATTVIAAVLADVMGFLTANDPDAAEHLREDMAELRDAIGLETHESTTDNRDTQAPSANPN
jgi:hypothetical protein